MRLPDNRFLGFALAMSLAWLGAPLSAAEDASDSRGGRRAIEDLLAGRFQWKISPPLVAPADRPEEPCYSAKDPSIVFYQGHWHLFCTIRNQKRGKQVEYLVFADWKEADSAPRHLLRSSDGAFGAPQVFYFAPQKQWYMICQASDKSWQPEYGAAYSTTTDIADPASWSKLKPLGAKRPQGTNHPDGKYGLDF
jgi:endo-1,4-beta-xylanase